LKLFEDGKGQANSLCGASMGIGISDVAVAKNVVGDSKTSVAAPKTVVAKWKMGVTTDLRFKS